VRDLSSCLGWLRRLTMASEFWRGGLSASVCQKLTLLYVAPVVAASATPHVLVRGLAARRGVFDLVAAPLASLLYVPLHLFILLL
jgi:hypothetical protein